MVGGIGETAGGGGVGHEVSPVGGLDELRPEAPTLFLLRPMIGRFCRTQWGLLGRFTKRDLFPVQSGLLPSVADNIGT